MKPIKNFKIYSSLLGKTGISEKNIGNLDFYVFYLNVLSLIDTLYTYLCNRTDTYTTLRRLSKCVKTTFYLYCLVKIVFITI